MTFEDCCSSVPFQNVRITAPFWTGRLNAIKSGSLPEMYHQMKVTGRWDSLKLQWRPGMPNMPHRFWDSDVAKWLEAACYILTLEPDEGLAQLVEVAVDNIRGAQQPDGYINTYYTVVEPGKRWTNLSWSHELYDAGHLLEAALAHNTYTHSNRLLEPLLKYVRHIESVFGLCDNQKAGYPGHQEIELALIKAYEQLEDKSLLELAGYFIEERGQPRPQGHYFDVEAKARGEPPNPGPTPKGAPKYSYHQADRPVRLVKSIEGHSVRAMYWLTAVTGMARLMNDTGLLNTAQKLWDSTTKRKMYVTGGLGAMSEWEGFGPDYVLPNETGYLETCAAIGLVFFAYQMLLINPHNTDYANVLELALYNAVLTGVSLDGKKFFYENPLATVGQTYERSAWFDCSCCPPNVARLIATLGKYIYTVGKDNTIYVHLYISCTTELTLPSGGCITIVQQSNAPWQGGARILVQGPGSGRAKFSLRQPLGAENFKVRTGPIELSPTPSGQVVLQAVSGIIEINFSYPPRIINPHPLDLDNRGCVALARGPFIYCAETIDNPSIYDLRALRLSPESTVKTIVDDRNFVEWGIEPVVLKVAGSVLKEDDQSKWHNVEVTMVPVCLWANRGKSDYRVWLPRRLEDEVYYSS